MGAEDVLQPLAGGLAFADGNTIDAHAVILATGVAYRQLTAPGLAELTGAGVFYGSALLLWVRFRERAR